MRADTDHDGRISQQEWTAFRALHPAKSGDPAKAFARMDANHDGYLTSDEMDAASTKMFARHQAMSGTPQESGTEPE